MSTYLVMETPVFIFGNRTNVKCTAPVIDWIDPSISRMQCPVLFISCIIPKRNYKQQIYIGKQENFTPCMITVEI